MDLNAELNKLLENPTFRRISHFMANPIIMTIVTVAILLIIVYFTNGSMFAIGFYSFIFLLILFHLHNTILINDLQKENISGEVRDLFTGAVEDRVEMPVNFKHPTDMFGRSIAVAPAPYIPMENYAAADDSHEYI